MNSQPKPDAPRAQADATKKAEAKLDETELDKRRPGDFQRLGDVVRRVVEKARRDG